ncbi:hypothetical protein C6P46_006265 [Rhodotorula mucilaginosa]|uniref:Uncharacterized protein n=1 Tax=Rhodotorula mucilaginosa TaxID=5537 RepID=A0A9P6VZ00_RHOMI|nr:hypothetical protein C6P46_006265 [Rhodotorula mucilaginosa]
MASEPQQQLHGTRLADKAKSLPRQSGGISPVGCMEPNPNKEATRPISTSPSTHPTFAMLDLPRQSAVYRHPDLAKTEAPFELSPALISELLCGVRLLASFVLLLSLLYFPFLTHLAYQAAWSTRDRPSEASS